MKRLLSICLSTSLLTASCQRQESASVPLHDSASPRVVLHDPATCTTCELRSELIVRLGGTGEDHVGPTMMIARLRDGRVILAHDQASDDLRVFDARGRFLRTIGRRGRGPGEFLDISAINVVGDTVLVHDRQNSRVTYLNSMLRVARTLTIPFMRMPPAGVVVAADGMLIVSADFHTGGLFAWPLHTVGPDGTILRSFGSTDDVSGADVAAATLRRLSVSDPATILAARWTRYLIEEYTVSGTLVRSIERDASWFKPWYHYPPRIDADTPLPPMLRAVRRDEDDLLWVVVEVPSLDWQTSGRNAETADGRQFVVDVVKSYDSMIEVLDPANGRLILSQRVDPHILHVLPTGEMVAINELEDGTPVLELWRYRIARR